MGKQIDYTLVAFIADKISGHASGVNALRGITGPEAAGVRGYSRDEIDAALDRLCAAMGGKFVKDDANG